MIGDLIGEFKGKSTGVRVLADGKLEFSDTGMGTILGEPATGMDTGVASVMPNGVTMLDGNSMIRTEEGDVVMIKVAGMGWPTGKGLKSSYRGATFHMTSSAKLASLNKTVGVWEYDTDENGNFSLKVWEWK